MEKYLKRLCNAIIADRFNDERYRHGGTYYGIDIVTKPLFCSYGEIGFTVTVYSDSSDQQYTVQYDWEIKELTIDDSPWKDFINILYLENNNLELLGNEDRSVEFECYTDAGEDMFIDLEEPTKENLQEYINDFDIDYNVSIWWPNGKPGKGVPFNNMKEQYEGYEAYLKWLQGICDKMPF